jgi:hypothetical protein
LRSCEYVLGSSLIDQEAMVEEQDTVFAGETHFMSDDHHRHSLVRERAHHAQDFADQFGCRLFE